MNKNLLLLFFLFSFGVKGQNLLEILRKDYRKVSNDSAFCAKLYEQVKDKDAQNALFSGYKGAISASLANHSKNKSEKIRLFTEGKKLLESSIAKDTASAELRFLRFTIQTSCPKALGYNKQIEGDKKFILANIHAIHNTTVQENIRGYMNSSNALTSAEKQSLKK